MWLVSVITVSVRDVFTWTIGSSSNRTPSNNWSFVSSLTNKSLKKKQNKTNIHGEDYVALWGGDWRTKWELSCRPICQIIFWSAGKCKCCCKFESTNGGHAAFMILFQIPWLQGWFCTLTHYLSFVFALRTGHQIFLFPAICGNFFPLPWVCFLCQGNVLCCPIICASTSHSLQRKQLLTMCDSFFFFFCSFPAKFAKLVLSLINENFCLVQTFLCLIFFIFFLSFSWIVNCFCCRAFWKHTETLLRAFWKHTETWMSNCGLTFSLKRLFPRQNPKLLFGVWGQCGFEKKIDLWQNTSHILPLEWSGILPTPGCVKANMWGSACWRQEQNGRTLIKARIMVCLEERSHRLCCWVKPHLLIFKPHVPPKAASKAAYLSYRHPYCCCHRYGSSLNWSPPTPCELSTAKFKRLHLPVARSRFSGLQIILFNTLQARSKSNPIW